MKKLYIGILTIAITFCQLLISSSTANAQTNYKKETGFFGSIESFYLRGGSIESAQLIGPALGYRFNDKYDISIHTELLFSEIKFSDRENGKTSLLNLGVTLGRTKEVTESLFIRSELSIYKLFNFTVEGFPEVGNPSLTSVQNSSSIFIKVPLSNTVTLLPEAGGFIGYGKYDPPVTDAELTQAFNGFVAGPKLGLNMLFTFSDSFYFILEPSYRHHFTDNAPNKGEVTLNFHFNF